MSVIHEISEGGKPNQEDKEELRVHFEDQSHE